MIPGPAPDPIGVGQRLPSAATTHMIDPIVQRTTKVYAACREEQLSGSCGYWKPLVQIRAEVAAMAARMRKARRALERNGLGWLFE